MQEDIPIHKIKVHPPKIHPTFTSIGYGNPSSNSMVVYKDGVLLSVGSHLRWTNLQSNSILFDKQIGCCQIFQIMENSRYILVISFDGLITLLHKDTLEQAYQFYAPGKEIKRSSFTQTYLALSCELLDETTEALLIAYKISDIEANNPQPILSLKGHFYYPQYLQDELTVLQYHDPNPKGRKGKDTVMTQKQPITSQILKFDKDFKVIYKYKIVEEGKIICASQNKGIIYYLHTTKRLTIFDIKRQQTIEVAISTKSFPGLVENYQDGVVYPLESNKLAFTKYNFHERKLSTQVIEIKSLAIGGNLSLKFSKDGIYSFNKNGLHFYSHSLQKTFTKSIFSITNCGIVLNPTGDMLAVADFSGSFFIFNTSNPSLAPDPLFSIFIGISIRSIAWCASTNNIVVSCLGGGLYWWKFGTQQPELVLQFDNTFNILRAVGQKIYAGASDGRVKIFDSETMTFLGQYKPHHPIHYQTQQERQLFGSMKNYAQIWSLAIPAGKQQLFIVSSCEDQTQKVYKANLQTNEYEMLHHLKGHQLAVTSIDWKLMNQKLGQVYVSCSDDQIIRFRDPKNHFKVLFQVQTSTIKEWHTLTYLALEPNGHRAAIGSQNGYLFIYDIEKRDLLFGQKIHLGGIQGLDWVKNKICTCSSDLCINIIQL